jgi:hypothetical protein
VLIAAAVLVLLVGVAIVNTQRSKHSGRTVPPTALPTPAAAALGCDNWPGLTAKSESEIPVPFPGHSDQAVLSWRCVDASGLRHPSLVHVVDSAADGGSSHVVATLIKPADSMHVDRIVTAPGEVSVRATYWGPAPSGYFPSWTRPGGLFSRTFTSTDGRFFIAQPPSPLAPSCGPNDLAVTELDGPGPGSWLLKILNFSGKSCVIEGYPTLTASKGAKVLAAAARTSSGRRGGLASTDVPPIVALTPGEIASALIERYASHAGCARADRLTVSLPAAGRVAQLAVDAALCAFEVHPVVAGSSGSG